MEERERLHEGGRDAGTMCKVDGVKKDPSETPLPCSHWHYCGGGLNKDGERLLLS